MEKKDLGNIPHQGINLRSRFKNFTLDCSHRYINPKYTIQMLNSNPAVRDIVQQSNLLKDDAFSIPIYLLKANIIPGQCGLDWVMGKGFTISQSYCSGIMEAIERYCCSLFREDHLVVGSYGELKEYAVDPKTLGVFREGPYSQNLPIDWIWAWNLTQKKNVLVPALCGLYISSQNNHWYLSSHEDKIRYTFSDANGCAAGNCVEEAIIHGIYEVLERDAITINARNNLRPPDVAVTSTVKNRYLNDILNKLVTNADFVLKIKYLTLDIGIPIFACVLLDKHKGYLSIGYGAHSDPEIALMRAIAELFQARVVMQERYRLNAKSKSSKYVELSHLEYLWKKGCKTISLGDIANVSTRDIGQDIKQAIEMLKRENMDVIAVKRIKEHIGVPAVKVIIPGVQRVDWTWVFENDLLATGSDRVFRVPQKIGLRTRLSTIQELDISQITFQ